MYTFVYLDLPHVFPPNVSYYCKIMNAHPEPPLYGTSVGRSHI